MNKSIYILPIFILFTIFSCSNDKDEDMDEKQDYTSFVVTVDKRVPETMIFPNCIAAYKKDNKYYIIENFGSLSSKTASREIIIKDKTIKEVYVFSDYNSVIRFDIVFNVENNIINQFNIDYNTKGIHVNDKSDPTQYPQ